MSLMVMRVIFAEDSCRTTHCGVWLRRREVEVVRSGVGTIARHRKALEFRSKSSRARQFDPFGFVAAIDAVQTFREFLFWNGRRSC